MAHKKNGVAAAQRLCVSLGPGDGLGAIAQEIRVGDLWVKSVIGHDDDRARARQRGGHERIHCF